VIDRRTFLAGTGAGLLAAPLAAEAQPVGKPIRIRVLTAQSRETSTASWESFRQGLRDLGWEDGRNIVIEARFAGGKFDLLPALAEELLTLNVALIVAANSPGARAAISATKTVPIVLAEVGDPVATGFVTNLARPGGNVPLHGVIKDSVDVCIGKRSRTHLQTVVHGCLTQIDRGFHCRGRPRRRNPVIRDRCHARATSSATSAMSVTCSRRPTRSMSALACDTLTTDVV
jgi:hypothetical protein